VVILGRVIRGRRAAILRMRAAKIVHAALNTSSFITSKSIPRWAGGVPAS